jgi:anti-sigma factor ChrR (cupin superfamily)
MFRRSVTSQSAARDRRPHRNIEAIGMEIFKTANDKAGLATPAAGSLCLSIQDLDWQYGGADGFWIKKLWQNTDDSERTWLMKVDAGAFAPMHAHDEVEQIYVLEGSFYDQERTVTAGDFIVRAAGTMHESGSKTGAVVLLVYTKSNAGK